MKLTEPSVEHARRRAQERLTRIERREDIARAARGEWNHLRQVEAEKAARLRALRLARADADNDASSRETARNASLSQAAAGPKTMPHNLRMPNLKTCRDE